MLWFDYALLYNHTIIHFDLFAGFTHQYIQMNELLVNFSGSPLSILGFPCNQFGYQEPAANETELMNGLKYVRPGSGFIPSFDIFAKGDVNGKHEFPLYTYLKVII